MCHKKRAKISADLWSASSPTTVAHATRGVVRLNMSHCQQVDVRELYPMTAFPLIKERTRFVRITNSAVCP